MVGIVIVSHSRKIAEGVVELCRQMAASVPMAAAGGLEDGEYTLGGQSIFVKGIECRLQDGTIAGSVLKMNDAVRNFRDHAGVPLHEAVNCASLYAARSIGTDAAKGSLEAGKDADIVLMDGDCGVRAVFVGGVKKV